MEEEEEEQLSNDEEIFERSVYKRGDAEKVQQ